MKKILSILTAAALLTAAVPVFPVSTAAVCAAENDADYEEAKNDTFSYRIYSDHIMITNIEKQGGDLVIPAEIDGLPVTDWSPDASIPGFYAFSLTVEEGNPYFETVNDALICKTSQVMILYTGKAGDKYSATMEKWLEGYEIPDGVKVIGKSAFRNAGFIHSVVFPDSIESLKRASLQGTSIAEITIPETVTEIEVGALNTYYLETITLEGENPAYQVIDGVLLTKDGKTLCCYPQADERTEYSIPEGTEELMEGCFLNCRNVTELTVPASLTGSLRPTESIQYLNTFHVAAGNPAYSEIGGVVFDKSGETLLKYPVRLCEDAEYIVPAGTTTIAEYAFYGAKFIGITFPESMETLPKNAMWGTEYRHLRYMRFLNPDCEIKESSVEFGVGVDSSSGGANVSLGTVFGFKGSTAEKYANRRDYAFYEIRSTAGDANADGAFNTADAETLENWLLQVPEQGVFCGKTADMDGSGTVNAADLALMKRALAEAPHCTVTVSVVGRSGIAPQSFLLSEGDSLYEKVDCVFEQNSSYEKFKFVGRSLTVSEIGEDGVKFSVIARNNSATAHTVEYGADFELNSLLYGRDDVEYSYVLRFSADTE